MTQTIEWRYETKYVLKADEPLLFSEWLADYPDIRPHHPSRRVNSIYFDTPDFECASANLSGVSGREKYRIRWYGSEGPGTDILFQTKSRRDRLGAKISHPIAWPGGNPTDLNRDTLEKITVEIDQIAVLPRTFGSLQPTLAVSYERAYFVTTSGVRITVDSYLGFDECDFDTPSEFLAHRETESTIVEFKFPTNAKQEASYLMAGLPFSASRSSKYLLGLSLIGRAIYL